MIITKLGIVPGRRKWQGFCRQCFSEAEAEESELTNIELDRKEGTRFSWEVCPVCKGVDESFKVRGMLFTPVWTASKGV